MTQAVQFFGATAILAAFAFGPTKILAPYPKLFATANAVGAAALAASAFVTHQWGFVLLNVVWTTVAIVQFWRAR